MFRSWFHYAKDPYTGKMGRKQLAILFSKTNAFDGKSFNIKSPEAFKDSALAVIKSHGNTELERIDLDGFLTFYHEQCLSNMRSV